MDTTAFKGFKCIVSSGAIGWGLYKQLLLVYMGIVLYMNPDVCGNLFKGPFVVIEDQHIPF